MWSKVIRFFKKGSPSREDLELWKDDILEELAGVKKTLRRQALFLEAFKKEALVQVGERVLQEAEPILQVAETFFYFDSSLRERAALGSSLEQAAEMVWQKLEAVLSHLGLELIRRTGEPFDPRIHQTVEKSPEHNGDRIVTKIIQPGYLYHGQVVRPARVIIGEFSTERNQES